MCKIIDLDELTNVCGYFEMETGVNNSYGCTHEDCEDKVVIDKNHNEVDFRNILIRHFQKYNLKKTRIQKKKNKEFKNALLEQEVWIKKLGYLYAGRCFSFSCPIATEADLEDLKKFDSYLYDEWKNEEYDPSECGSNLMIISDSVK